MDDTSKTTYAITLFVIPGYLSLLPPLVTLILATTLGNVLLALLTGIWTGATLTMSGNAFSGFFRTFDTYWKCAFTDDNHAGVLLFTFLLAGTIGVVQKSGGGLGLANLFSKTVMTTRLSTQVSTWILSFFIFFDDFAAILIVGNSLREAVVAAGVSKAKFAAIVHIVAICIPSMAPVSSWIGVELGYIAAQNHNLEIGQDPFMMVLTTLQVRLFPLLLLGFISIVILFERDFGPMLHHEREAVRDKLQKDQEDNTAESFTSIEAGVAESNQNTPVNPLDPNPGTPLRWINAVLPFTVIVLFTFLNMIFDGFQNLEKLNCENGNMDDISPTLFMALSHSNSVSSLIRSSALGCLVAFVLVLVQKILTLNECMSAWIQGINDVLEPTMVLLLAWALGSVMSDIHVAAYLSSVLQHDLPASLLPFLTALLCYIVSFATGSAFGTMAIMFPIIAPLSFQISSGNLDNLTQCYGAILGSSIFGNVCSPIADTVILTSLSAALPITAHVSTILPYCLTVAGVSSLGYLVLGLGLLNPFMTHVICFGLLLAIVLLVGENVEATHRDRYNSTFTTDLGGDVEYVVAYDVDVEEGERQSLLNRKTE